MIYSAQLPRYAFLPTARTVPPRQNQMASSDQRGTEKSNLKYRYKSGYCHADRVLGWIVDQVGGPNTEEDTPR